MNNTTRILIVEDQRSDYELAQHEIQKAILNCQFERVEKEADFLNALEIFKPDIILSDYKLPQFNGIRVLELVQQQFSLTPVIIWTGALSEDIAVECMKQGASDYVIKENIKRLGLAVRHALKEREETIERRQAEERFQNIFENSPIGIFQSTPQGRFIRVNASMARIYGYASPQEMIDSITDISSEIYIDAHDRDQFTHLLQTNARVENFEMKNLRKDGSEFWTSTSARSVQDESGNILYYEGFLQDITDRKLAEGKLLESEGRYRGIFENVQDAIFVESPDGNILEVNQRACEIFGYSRQEFLQKKVRDIVPASGYIINIPDVHLYPGQIIETINVRANGERFPVEISGGLYEFGDRSLFLVILRDISERKEAEQQLRKQEQRFRALIENGLDNISLLARDGTLIWENPSVNSSLGYEQNAFVNRNIFELMHPDDIARTSELFAKVVAKPGNQQTATFRVKHHDGTWRCMEATATNMLDEPSVNAVVINYRDVTERKLIENALQESEERYRLIAQNAEDMIWTMNLKMQLTFVSPAVEQALGYSAEEILASSVEQFLTPESFEIGIKVFSEELKKAPLQPDPDYSRILELEYRRKDGSVFWVEMKFSLFRDIAGHPTGILGVGRDITKRREADQELKESQFKYRNLVETSNDLIWSVDAEGRFTFINHAAKEIYGYEPEELIGRFYFEVMDGRNDHLTPETFKKGIAKIQNYQTNEVHVRHRDGRKFILSANSIVLRDEHGNVTGVTGTSRDITGQKKIEEALREERNLLRTLIDNLPDRIYAMDKQGRKTLSNVADCRASGKKTMEEVIGKTDFDLYPPELAEPFWQLDKALLDSGQPLINFEEPGLDFDGNRVSILTTKIPLRDTEGNVSGLVGVGRDITARKQAQARINDLLSLNEKILNYSPLGILAYKLSGECIFANQNAAVITGTTIENLLSQNFHSIEAWKKSGLYTQIQKAIETRNVVMADLHHISTFGKDIWMTIHCVTFTTNNEDHVLLSILDITERKQAEAKLLQSQQELNEAQRVAKIGSWSFDAVKNKVQWSDELYRIYGVAQEDFDHTYEAFFALVHPDDRWKVQQKNDASLREGTSFEAEYRIITSAGDVKTISEIGYAVPAEDGQVVSLFGTAQDITERKRSELERQALFEIMQGLAITNDLQEFLKLIHMTIAKVIYAENFFVVFHHPDTGLFEEIYSVDQYDPPAPPSQLEKSITSYVFRSGNPLLLKEDGFGELEAQGEVELIGAPSASWLGVPLKTPNGTIGVIVVQDYQDTNRYSEPDKNFLASIATQVALAIERKQADIELQQKNDDLGLISVINEAIVRGQDLDAVIELLTKELRRIFSAVGSTIYMLSPDKRSISMEQYSFSSEIAQRIEKLLGFKIPRVEFPIQDGGHFHHVITSEQSLITKEPHDIQKWIAEFAETKFLPRIVQAVVRKLIPQIYKLLNIRSTIAVPLISGQEVIGILDVSSSNLFNESDLKRIENIGEQLTAILQRQQVNEKIRKSEEFLQGVQDSLSAHVAILDQRGMIIRVNAAWREFGRQNGSQSRDHAVGLNYLDICDAVTGPEAYVAHQVATGIREVLAGQKQEVSVEYPCHSLQEKRWFTVHITCFDDGEQKWVILAHENITTRMIAEMALKESTAQLRTLFEATPDAIMLMDPHNDWSIVDCNSAACKINGYAREELIGKSVDMLNTERSTVESNSEYFKRIQDTDVLRYETKHVRKDGTVFPIEVSTSLIRLGERDLVLGIDRDITERKRAETAEREQRILAEALRDTSEILSSSLDYGKVLDHILAAVGQVVPHDAATITLIEEGSARVVRSQGYEKHASSEQIMGIRLSLADTTNLRTMLETKQPLIVYDTHTYAGWKRMESTDWLRSNVGAPISINGKIIGFILLDSQTAQFFTALHAERLQAFANQAAVAIHHANLLQQAQNEIAERKRAEAALQAEQEKVKNYLEIAGVIMLALDQHGTVTLINQKGCEILGYSAEEILGKNWINTFLPETTRHEMQEVFQQLMSDSTELVAYYENTILCRDGNVRLIAWHNTLVRDKQGTIITSLSSGEDITERKYAEEELRASEERFRQLADNIPEVFWVTDAQTGQELYASPATEKVWGYSSEYFLQEPEVFTNSVFSEDLPMVLQNVEKEKNGENVEMEYRVVHPDGTIHWIWDRAFPVFDETGTVKTLAGIAADVTERKQAEMALQQSQARYYDIFDNSPISLWEEDYSLVKQKIESLRQAGITDLNEYLSAHPNEVLELGALVRVIDVNRASLELYHAETKEDLLGNLLDFISQETVLHLREEVLGLISSEARFTWEGEDKTLDGQELTVMVNGSIAPGYEQTWSKVIVSIHDVTERKQAEEKLRTSEERYHRLFQNLVDGFALHEIITNDQDNPVDYVFLEINPAFEKLTGLTATKIIGRRATEVLPGMETERFIPIYGQVALTGQPIHFEEYSAALNKYFEINAYAPRHGQFAVTFIDVTERKHSEKEIDRRAKETSALLETSLALTNLDSKAILQTIGNSARTLFAADGCRVFLMEPDDETLRCVMAIQENADAFHDLKIQLGEGVTGAVAASGKAEIVNEMQNDPRAVQVQGTENEQESIMFAPLKERDHTIGVLSIRRAGVEHPFQPTDLELLEAFASMAASAVSNARLFEQAQHRLDELEAIYENGLAVGQLLEPKEIGNRVIETFANHLSWHHVTIRLLRPETDELEVIAFNLPGLNEDQKIEMEHHFNQMVSKTGQGLSGWVAQTGIPLRTGNVQANPRYVGTQKGIQSGLYMPLKIGDRTIGVISVESKAPDAFTEQDQRLLATLGSQAAVAFENARLYQAAHQELLERTRAQAALWASETHYRELADSITDILFELDYNLKYTHWNKASEMFSGLSAEDAIGKSIQEVWGESAEQLKRQEIYESVLKERQAKSFEIEVRMKDRNQFLEIHAYPSTRGVSVVARDITERKLIEKLTEKRFELIEYSSQHATPEVMQKVIDEVSKLTESHIGFMHFVEEDEKTIALEMWSTETLHGFCQTEAGNTHYPVDKAGVWADAIRQRRASIHNDYQALPDKKGLPEGHAPVIRELVIPIIRGEKIVAVIGVGNKAEDYTQHDIEIAERFADYAWDIIERRQMAVALAEERNQLAKRVEERTADLSRANSNLARALRVKDEFLANMSHELRTPLNAILGLSESLGEQVAGPLNEKQQKYLNTINESGHHLLSLINDILDLAKIEAGQIILDINKVDVNAVCQASLRMIKQLAQKKNQEVLFDIDSNVGWMWADERRLKQMIVNLLSNAVKFTPESGQLGLEVHGDEAANRVLLTIWDNGIGISDQDMDRIFKPFVQLDSGLAREATGTGLGLALVAQMARLHGGSVSVESQAGKGSRFTILLPWEPALAMDASTRLRNTGKFHAIDLNITNKPTILVIEDTREVVMMLVDYLEMSGFKMITAQDGTDGLQQAKLFHPNLILMDVMMPGMDGFETTRRLRLDPQFKDTPIIALTALAMPSDRQRCLDAGMDEYISKPVNLKALVKLIESILIEKDDTRSK